MPDFTELDARIALKKALREAQETAETFRASTYALEERIEQLIKELDEARHKAAEWEQTARELMKRVKP